MEWRLKPQELFDLSHSIAGPLLAGLAYPWEALESIAAFLTALGETLPPDRFDHPAGNIWIAKDAQIAPSASLCGPLIVDEGAQIRHCAFVRGSAIVGKGAVVGNSTELKNCILFDGAQAPHYNYIGDSILGYKAHMGAGSITSNLRSDKGNITVHGPEIRTGMRKFGAMIGDFAEIGCGSVLNPGTVIGRETIVYPLSSVRGCVAEKSIYKHAGEIAARIEKE
ncbi:MAG TPA: UDP-N-acetylglucosamine pyrophosphorylase [Candidatus Aphodomonas merdavium]|nr:UDP-N-acetylglucosamine pyrophosphorylase [Candidatus Aphodomonas merdavium]